MIELLMVVVIIGIGAAVTTFSLNATLPDLRLKQAVRELKSDMALARLRAVRENSFVAMVFNTAANSYTIFVDDGAGGGSAGDYVIDPAETVIKSVTMPNNVTMYAAVFGAVPRTRFNGRGFPGSPLGHVYLRNTKDSYWGVTLSRLGRVQVRKSTDHGVNWFDVK
jgi:Tfp pilus assembly protein FimT